MALVDVAPYRPSRAPRREPFTNETALAVACAKRIREPWGWRGAVIKIHGNAEQLKGTPDLLACVAGRFCAVELKQPGKEPTPLQWKRLRDWRDAGALAGYVTTEVELDELLAHHADTGWSNPQFAR